MTTFDYFTPPSDAVFDEIKATAIQIWKAYEDGTPGAKRYVESKIERIKDIQNVKDNAWYMVAMFDHVNQSKLISLVSIPVAQLILEALRAS